MVGREVRSSVESVVTVVVVLGSVGGVAGLVASMFVRDMTGIIVLNVYANAKRNDILGGFLLASTSTCAIYGAVLRARTGFYLDRKQGSI